MKQDHLDKLLDAAQVNPHIYGDLLRKPQETAMALGIELEIDDLRTLRRAAAAVTTAARKHDDYQGRSGKVALFFPVVATLPSKRKRKAPKPPKRKPRKPS